MQEVSYQEYAYVAIEIGEQIQPKKHIILGHTVVCATNMQLNVYNMDTCHKKIA
jgi:hypothetical protein